MFLLKSHYPCALALTLLAAPCLAQPALQREAPSPARKTLARATDPESTGMVLDLLTRYARGTGNTPKTDLDQKLERSLSRNPKAKASVQRILARLSALSPERRQALLGQRAITSLGAPISQAQLRSRIPKTFSRPGLKPKQDDDNDRASALDVTAGFQVASLAPLGALLPKPQPTVTLSYRALRCRQQSNDGPALPGTRNLDEPYIIFNVLSFEGTEAVLESSKKHPGDSETYTNVGKGTTVGRVLNLYSGAPKLLQVQVIVMENDFGDPEEYREDSETLARGIVDSIADNGGNAKQNFSEAEKLAMEWATRLLADFTMALLGDDVIADEVIDFTPEELTRLASKPLKTAAVAELAGQKVKYSLYTDHKGEDGASYRAYFQVR